MRMIKKSIYMFITLALSLIAPAPARFSVGFVLVLLLNLLMLAATSFRHLVEQLKLGDLTDIVVIGFMIFFAMLYRQILVFISPETVIQLGFLIFLPVVSSYFVGYIFGTKIKQLQNALAFYMKNTLVFSIFLLAFFFVREIISFGTFSYLTFSGVKEIVLFNVSRTTSFTFLATIPGGLLCLALTLSMYIFVMNKMHILKRADYDGQE